MNDFAPPHAPLTGQHIVITRPADQATKLTALINAAGGTAHLFPLLAITPLHDYSTFEQTITQLPQYDQIIFISSNAVQNAMPRILRQFPLLPHTLQFCAIGPVTAQELQAFGVKQVLTPVDRFDSESLLALPQMQTVAGKKILIVRGIGGRDLLANTLTQRGASVQFAECYQRVNPQTNADFLRQLWHNKQLHSLVITSSEAMRSLLQLVDTQHDLWLKQIRLCVNHARVAQPALALGLNAQVAAAPGDEAMLQLLAMP